MTDKKTEKTKTLTERLAKIQTELHCPKENPGQFGKSRSCADILEKTKPYLNGLTLTLSDKIEAFGSYIYVTATATLSDGKDIVETSASARDAIEKRGTDASQLTGMASSYARKYALNGLFAIDDTKDADTTDNTMPTSASDENRAQTSQSTTMSIQPPQWVLKDEIQTYRDVASLGEEALKKHYVNLRAKKGLTAALQAIPDFLAEQKGIAQEVTLRKEEAETPKPKAEIPDFNTGDEIPF